MGIELDILREFATISATLGESASIANTINSQIKGGDFSARFNKMFEDIGKCYDVVIENILPLSGFDSEPAFIDGFDASHAAYTECYLKEISKPRVYSDDAYEEYLLLKTMKESKTGFPLLKRSFERMDQFVDKWITNDAWLAMSIDNLFKRLQTMLNEIAALKKKDTEDAFLIYRFAFNEFAPFLTLLEQGRALEKSAGNSLEKAS
jgi:hypothetical protein